MNSNRIAGPYRELAVKGATPVGLVILLYDMAIESLARATREIDAGNMEARTAELKHAMAVITELQRSLNLEAGGHVARRLTDLYDVARGKITGANIKSNKEIVDRLTGVLSSVREARLVVEEKNSGEPEMNPAPEAPRSSSAPTAPSEQHEEQTQLRWSA